MSAHDLNACDSKTAQTHKPERHDKDSFNSVFNETLIVQHLNSGSFLEVEQHLKKLIGEFSPYNWRPYYYLTLALDVQKNMRRL